MTTFAELNLLECAGCKLSTQDLTSNNLEPVECSHCGKRVAVYLFPALIRTETPAAAPEAAAPSESSCFYHAGKRATVVCEGCGRFLCELCKIDFEGRTLCTACLEGSAGDSKKAQSGNKFFYYDSLALGYSILGFLFFFFAIIFGSLTLYTVVRHWKTPLSSLPRSRWRYVLAALLAVTQLTLWVLFVFVLVASV